MKPKFNVPIYIRSKQLYSTKSKINKPYRCHLCPIKCSTKYTLKRHQIKFHKFSYTTRIMKNKKTVKCPDKHCNKMFTTRSNANAHFRRDHLGIYIYNCGKCGRQSDRKDRFNKHDCNDTKKKKKRKKVDKQFGKKKGKVYKDRAYIVGLWNTDGWNGDDDTVNSGKVAQIALSTKYSESLIISLANRFGSHWSRSEIETTTGKLRRSSFAFYEKNISSYLRKYKSPHCQYTVPDECFNDKQFAILYLRGLWDGDGTYSDHNNFDGEIKCATIADEHKESHFGTIKVAKQWDIIIGTPKEYGFYDESNCSTLRSNKAAAQRLVAFIHSYKDDVKFFICHKQFKLIHHYIIINKPSLKGNLSWRECVKYDNFITFCGGDEYFQQDNSMSSLWELLSAYYLKYATD
eukprot:65060_1